jgi:hypothetical protein
MMIRTISPVLVCLSAVGISFLIRTIVEPLLHRIDLQQFDANSDLKCAAQSPRAKRCGFS